MTASVYYANATRNGARKARAAARTPRGESIYTSAYVPRETVVEHETTVSNLPVPVTLAGYVPGRYQDSDYPVMARRKRRPSLEEWSDE